MADSYNFGMRRQLPAQTLPNDPGYVGGVPSKSTSGVYGFENLSAPGELQTALSRGANRVLGVSGGAPALGMRPPAGFDRTPAAPPTPASPPLGYQMRNAAANLKDAATGAYDKAVDWTSRNVIEPVMEAGKRGMSSGGGGMTFGFGGMYPASAEGANSFPAAMEERAQELDRTVLAKVAPYIKSAGASPDIAKPPESKTIPGGPATPADDPYAGSSIRRGGSTPMAISALPMQHGYQVDPQTGAVTKYINGEQTRMGGGFGIVPSTPTTPTERAATPSYGMFQPRSADEQWARDSSFRAMQELRDKPFYDRQGKADAAARLDALNSIVQREQAAGLGLAKIGADERMGMAQAGADLASRQAAAQLGMMNFGMNAARFQNEMEQQKKSALRDRVKLWAEDKGVGGKILEKMVNATENPKTKQVDTGVLQDDLWSTLHSDPQGLQRRYGVSRPEDLSAPELEDWRNYLKMGRANDGEHGIWPFNTTVDTRGQIALPAGMDPNNFVINGQRFNAAEIAKQEGLPYEQVVADLQRRARSN